MKLILAFLSLSLPWSASAAIVPASTSSRVLYASQVGAKLNSSVWAGGGTDDSAPLQYGLDLATNYAGYIFIVDGAALVSTNLVIRSNTKIVFPPGAGLFMAPHANCWVLGNQQNTNYSTTNVVIEGGILNANGNFQSEYVTNGYRLSGAPGTWGMWFAGADNVIIRDTTIVSAKAYTYLFSDSRNILMDNCRAYYTNNTIITNTLYGNDGVHLMCNVANFTCRNFRYTSGSDDGFAIMTDETDFTLPVQDPRWTTNSGYMTNILFDGFLIENGKNVGKIQTYGSTNAAAHNVTIKNVRGQSSTQGFLVLASGLKANNFTVDGFDIQMGGSADSFGYPYLSAAGLVSDTIRISNVRIVDRQGTGIGSTGLIALSGATNYLLSNIYVEGGPVTGVGNGGSVAADDTAIALISLAGQTNEPFLSINNLQAKTLAGMISTGDGTGVNTPNGIIRASGVILGPGVVINDGTFTNIFCLPPTNNPASGQAIVATGTSGAAAWAAVTAIAPIVTQTNFLPGFLYSNNSGRPQEAKLTAVLTLAAVTGSATIEARIGVVGTTTNYASVPTGAAVVTGADKQTMSVAIPIGATYTFTNTSSGAGNSATISGGQLTTF